MNKSVRINYLGDSHSVLTFGQTTLDALVQKRISIHFVALSGLHLKNMWNWKSETEAPLTIKNFEYQSGKSAQFSNDPKEIGKEFDLNGGDILILALGTNDIVNGSLNKMKFEDDLEGKIKKAFEYVTTKKVIYIEPPLLKMDADSGIRKKLLNLIRSTGASVIPCDKFSADQEDGVHMKKEMAREFGNYVSKELLELIFPHH